MTGTRGPSGAPARTQSSGGPDSAAQSGAPRGIDSARAEALAGPGSPGGMARSGVPEGRRRPQFAAPVTRERIERVRRLLAGRSGDPRSQLWRRPAFVRLWTARTVSASGSQLTAVALPLLAAGVLQATPLQMGLLRAAGAAPSLALGLLAGAWVDRVRRRPLLLAADLGRALLLGTVPLAAVLGVLRFEQLLVVAFLTAALGLLFGLASRAYLPAVVRREDLVAANGALAAGSRAAGIAGPAIGGALVQALGAPVAVALDALSFGASALLLRGIRAPEPAPPPPEARPGWGAAVGEGLRAVLGHPLLRPLALAAGLFELFDSAVFAVYVLYATRDVGLAPAVLGLVFAAGAVGGLAGVALSGRVARRLGPAPALSGAFMVAALGELLIPVAGILAGTGAPPWAVAVLLATAEVVVNAAVAVYGVVQVSLVQEATPEGLRGRVFATTDVLAGAAGLVGAIAGGILGQAIGLQATVILCGLATLLSALWLAASPVRSWITPTPDRDRAR